ncbi:MAG: L,D-transpeptidase [Lachnospiraceae bacterium]|nr:L,D-transpeptidase [Lachnospiraceae bacterium]
MIKKVLTGLIALVTGTLLLAAAGCLVMNKLYEGRFGLGVWLNDVYVTGLTPLEAARALDGTDTDPEGLPAVVMLIGRNDDRLAVPTDRLSITSSYLPAVKEVYALQTPLSLLRGLTGGVHCKLTPTLDFNRDALAEAINAWDIFEDTSEPQCASIEQTPEGYQLVMNVEARPVREAILKTAEEKIGGGEYFVSLDTDGSCYEEQVVTEADRSVMATFEAIEKTRIPNLSYRLGDETITLDASVTDRWLLTGAELHALYNGAGNPAAAGTPESDDREEAEEDATHYLIGGEHVEMLPEDAREVNGFAQSANGELIIKEEEIAAFVMNLCDRYSTLNKTRDFTTHDGRVIQVPAGTYGNEIDTDAEMEWLMEAVKNRPSGEHVPVLTHEARQLGTDDIGKTYVEVDIGQQMLYYFENGRIDMEMPVVTGCHSRHFDTPPGVYDIYFMQRNRTLRGDGYESFVHYWMAFYKHYGLHDATWRGTFGNEIYRNSGSHGCVNLPYASAGPLYEKVEVGTPVIVHE